MTKARLRRHADAPANWQWRPRPDGTGRPRWIPSPTLRKAGWKARDLKDETGTFLSEGRSRDAARDINAAVATWRRGEIVPAGFSDICPAGAAEDGPAPLPQAVDRLAIGRLLDAWVGTYDPKTKQWDGASREFGGTIDKQGRQTGGLKPSTQASYRKSLKRFVDTLAGYVELPARDDAEAQAAYQRAVATVRAALVTILKPVETRKGMSNVLYTAYWALFEKAGKHQAYAVLAAVSAWLAWCRRHQSTEVVNWASDIRRSTPPGRIRPLTLDEVKALVRTADAEGYPSIADAVVLGIDLSWSQIDRLSLTWSRLTNDRAFSGTDGRAKTGRVGGTPLTSLGRARVAAIRRRHADMDAHPTHVLWCEDTGRPWEGDHYRKVFARIRTKAAIDCPSLLVGPDTDPTRAATDQDLRDTAFTWMSNAGLSDDGIASRTLQGRQSIKDLGDKAYGEIGPQISEPQARLYDAYLQKIGASL